MKEAIHDAKEELKRVDHQIYVSLKYTRTVDVLMNCVGRMIDAYACMNDALLKYAVERKIVREEYVPLSPIERLEFARSIFPGEPIVQSNMELYALMRKIVKTPAKKEQEFRRHVAGKMVIDNKEVVVNIDIVTEYYVKMKEFCDWIDRKIHEVK